MQRKDDRPNESAHQGTGCGMETAYRDQGKSGQETAASHHRERERELLRVNRALSTFTRATEALIHATDEQQLLNDICRIMVEIGGYMFAWVGYVQHDDERSVWPVARFGNDGGYIAKARISWDENSPRGCGPTGNAIRSGKIQVAYTDTTASFAPWREAALASGFKASLSLPLYVENRVIGVLHLYTGDSDGYDQDELHLMENLARNVAYGIGMQRMQFERRRAERELKESEGRYRSLVELSPDAIIVHTQGIIIFSNSAADTLFRVNPLHPLVGRRIVDLVHPDDAEQARIYLDSGEHLGAVEERLARLDGGYFVAEVTSAPIIFHGVHARQVVIRDITERKQVHAQLVQTAKLATLGEMAAGMAHELSQPINIIRMAAEGALLLIGRNKADPAYLTKQFGLVASQAARMAEIIDHIRIFSRKDTGEVAVFDARTSLALAVELMQPQMQSAGIEISTTLPSTPCPLRGRPVQLEQVIINLMSNAADAVKSAREQTQRAGRIKLETSLNGDGEMVITVTDNGTGISQADLDRIFEPFFTTKEVGSGTGLGLSVSFGIISSMGGRLIARNAKPHGAQFVITLPMTSTAALTAVPTLQPHPEEDADEDEGRLPGRHVLLVDDELQALDAMGDYLSELGYRISKANSGNSALRAFEDDPSDIVVTDIRMPDGDGEGLIKALRRLDPSLPIVVVTGHIGATESIEDQGERHTFAMLKKPISLAVMAETLEQLLQNQ